MADLNDLLAALAKVASPYDDDDDVDRKLKMQTALMEIILAGENLLCV